MLELFYLQTTKTKLSVVFKKTFSTEWKEANVVSADQKAISQYWKIIDQYYYLLLLEFITENNFI